MRFVICTLYVILIIVTSSCGDFLEVNPKSEITTDRFYETADDATAAVNAVYDGLDTGYSGLWWRGVYLVTELPTDNAVPGIGVENVQITSINNYTHDPSNTFISNYWIAAYEAINRANAAVDNISRMEEIDESLQNRLIGEARFLRALNYFLLVRLFGDIPMTLEETTSVADLDLSRSPVEEVYDAIIADLEFAEANLLPFSSTEAGRASISAARALLADVYLTLEEWELAAQKASEVVSSGEHRLMENFEDVFRPETSINQENIFAILYQSGSGTGANNMTMILPRNTFPGPVAWGADVPNPDYYDLFEDSPRKDRTFFTEFVYEGELYEFEEGPHWFKVVDTNNMNNTTDIDSDLPVLRYAEVLLILAEADNELNGGPTARAYDAVNSVRARAYGDIGSSEHHLPPGLSQQEFREAVWHERHLEFGYENKRWFDLKRTGRLVEVMHEAGFNNVQDFHYRFPIPQVEIDANPNVEQNPGY